jgi:hypothetical protein
LASTDDTACAQTAAADPDDDIDLMLDEFLALPDVVAVGGLELQEASVATGWPV